MNNVILLIFLLATYILDISHLSRSFLEIDNDKLSSLFEKIRSIKFLDYIFLTVLALFTRANTALQTIIISSEKNGYIDNKTAMKYISFINFAVALSSYLYFLGALKITKYAVFLVFFFLILSKIFKKKIFKLLIYFFALISVQTVIKNAALSLNLTKIIFFLKFNFFTGLIAGFLIPSASALILILQIINETVKISFLQGTLLLFGILIGPRILLYLLDIKNELRKFNLKTRVYACILMLPVIFYGKGAAITTFQISTLNVLINFLTTVIGFLIANRRSSAIKYSKYSDETAKLFKILIRRYKNNEIDDWKYHAISEILEEREYYCVKRIAVLRAELVKNQKEHQYLIENTPKVKQVIEAEIDRCLKLIDKCDEKKQEFNTKIFYLDHELIEEFNIEESNNEQKK